MRPIKKKPKYRGQKMGHNFIFSKLIIPYTFLSDVAFGGYLILDSGPLC